MIQLKIGIYAIVLMCAFFERISTDEGLGITATLVTLGCFVGLAFNIDTLIREKFYRG